MMTKMNRLHQIIFIAIIVLIIISAYIVHARLTSTVIVRNIGQLSTTKVWAKSGYWRDIQAAVDAAAAAGGGTVYIPEGVWNFVNVNESWTKARVIVPSGVNIFGAPTERYANSSVKEWKTVLVMPWEVPTTGPDDMPAWFRIVFNETYPERTTRISDLKLVGYRYFNTNSKTMYIGIQFYTGYASYPTAGLINFRIDHCCFQDLAGSGIWGISEAEYNRRSFCGVIDHNVFVNTYGNPGLMNYDARTLGYGVGLRRWASDVWDYDVSNIHGKYTNYTVFIEDNYFSKWRHSVCSNDGFHVVFRHNIVERDYAIGSVDGHGSYADDSHPYAVGTRAYEVYDNIFRDPDTTWTKVPWALNIRGGSWIVFNNTLIGYNALCDLNNDWGNYAPYCPQCHINQTYIWNNSLGGANIIKYNSDNTQDVHYFLRAPNLQIDRWVYTPYPYPHPLTLEQSI